MTARIVVPAALVLIGAALVAPASAGSTASRIVDRTFSCETGFVGGVYQAEIDFYWSVPPQAPRRTPTASYTSTLGDGLLGGSTPTSIHANRLHCTATGARLPLTTKGLRSRSVVFSERFDCFTPRRVLLRMRGGFLQPTTLQTASPVGYPQVEASGTARQTELAMGTPAGKPIAYTSMVSGKKPRLFTSSNCKED